MIPGTILTATCGAKNLDISGRKGQWRCANIARQNHNNFDKNLPASIPSERWNVNLFGALRKIRIIGTISGADVGEFTNYINLWFNERNSNGRYIRSKFSSDVIKAVIETARMPESYPSDILKNYELVLVQGKNWLNIY